MPVAAESTAVTAPPPDDAPDRNYRRGALAVLPFLAIGLADVGLVVAYGVDPVWGLAVVPPIAFICALAWIAFSTEFLEDRTGNATEHDGTGR